MRNQCWVSSGAFHLTFEIWSLIGRSTYQIPSTVYAATLRILLGPACLESGLQFLVAMSVLHGCYGFKLRSSVPYSKFIRLLFRLYEINYNCILI